MDKFFVKLTSEYSRIFANRNDDFFFDLSVLRKNFAAFQECNLVAMSLSL